MLASLGLLFVLLIATSFFVASEFALVSVRRTRIDQLVSDGNSTAAQVRYAMDHLQDYIAATQVGITMAALGLGAWGEPAVSSMVLPLLTAIFPEQLIKGFVSLHGVAFIIGYLIVTIVEIVFGELVPKIIAREKAEKAVLLIIRPLNFFALIARPLIWVINLLGNAVLKLLRLEPGGEGANVHSVEELEMLVASSRQAGVLEEEEEAILRRVFDLGDLSARQVMLPRTEVAGVPVESSLRETIEIMENVRHSRFPVYDGSLDRILGVLHVKDVFLTMARKIEAQPELPSSALSRDFSVRALMRPIKAFPETINVNDLLTEMLRGGTHMALVVDEYGGTAGIVTLEDVVEEIVGEVHDEFEAPEERPDIQVTPDGTLVNGMTPIDDLNERLGLEIETEADTVGGYVFERLGRKPELGDEVSVNGYTVRVEELDGLRIAEVRLLARNQEPQRVAEEDE